MPKREGLDGVRVTVRLTPGAGVDRIDDPADGTLRARVAARPVGGAANEALARLLAEALGLARTRVTIVRGQRGRLKVVRLAGVDAEALRSRWPGVDV